MAIGHTCRAGHKCNLNHRRTFKASHWMVCTCFVQNIPHIPLAKPGHRTKTKVRESSKHILPSVNHGKGERKRKNCKQIMQKKKKRRRRKASLVAHLVKNSLVIQETACNAGETWAISGLGKASGEENGNPLQYSCLGSPMDRGALWATVHGVAELDMT